MELIDTHCHLDVTDFDHDREQVITKCINKGIYKLIIPAIEAAGWDNLVSICEANHGLFYALGLHPVFTNRHKKTDVESLEKYIHTHSPVAVGEIGLDFYIKEVEKQQQINLFENQLKLAEHFQLPVILHVRKAHEETLGLLKKYSIPGGTCHAFNGSFEQANRYIDMGFKLGFGGTITYPNANKIRKLAKEVNLKHIVLETDAPDMSGFLHRGERNSPEYLPDALKALSQIKEADIEHVASMTTANANAVFNL